MLHFTYFIHGNLQYAEFPDSAVPDIVERSYLPTLEHFAAHPNLKAAFEFSGVSLERMAEQWPETIELLRKMVARGQIELLGSTYANPILPLIPSDHAYRQVVSFCQIYDRLFGDLAAPAGIYLQEFAYSPHLTPMLNECGYSYTFLTPELLHAGMRSQSNSVVRPPIEMRGPQTRNLARLELLHPLQMLGAGETQLTAVPLQREFIDLLFSFSSGETSFEEIADLLTTLDGAHCRNDPGLIVFGPSDAEFIGFYDYMGRRAITIEKLAELMMRVAELPFIELSLPREYLESYPPERQVYVPAGTSEPSFDIWTKDPDNQRLNALCEEAASKLRLAEMAASAWEMGETVDPRLGQAWKAMLLAENSDGRGWLPCPERRLFCYNQALRVIRISEALMRSSIRL